MNTHASTPEPDQGHPEMPPAEPLRVHMKYGLPGFENLTSFALDIIPDVPPFQMLISEDENSFALLVLDIAFLKQENELLILVNELKVKGIRDDKHHILLVLKLDRVRKVFTANVKAPIVINRLDGSGSQMIMDNPDLPVDFVLTKV